jgi:hypothetical protein
MPIPTLAVPPTTSAWLLNHALEAPDLALQVNCQARRLEELCLFWEFAACVPRPGSLSVVPAHHCISDACQLPAHIASCLSARQGQVNSHLLIGIIRMFAKDVVHAVSANPGAI